MALKKLSENKFAHPFVVTGIIVTRLLVAITCVVLWVVGWVIGYPLYLILYALVAALLGVAQFIYPEGFEDELGAPARLVSCLGHAPNPCDVCD